MLRQSSQRLRIVQRDMLLQRFQRKCSIHGSALEVDVAESLCQSCGNGALARASRAVDGDHEWPRAVHSPSPPGRCCLPPLPLRGRRSTNGLPRRTSDVLTPTSGFDGGAVLSGRAFADCNITFPPTCTNPSSRAAWSALTASRTRARPTRGEKKFSTSSCDTATTQSTYFDTSAVNASATETCMPSRTASGAQRNNTSQNTPSSCL